MRKRSSAGRSPLPRPAAGRRCRKCGGGRAGRITIAASASHVNVLCSGGASHPSDPAASHVARRPRTRMLNARTGAKRGVDGEFSSAIVISGWNQTRAPDSAWYRPGTSYGSRTGSQYPLLPDKRQALHPAAGLVAYPAKASLSENRAMSLDGTRPESGARVWFQPDMTIARFKNSPSTPRPVRA